MKGASAQPPDAIPQQLRPMLAPFFPGASQQWLTGASAPQTGPQLIQQAGPLQQMAAPQASPAASPLASLLAGGAAPQWRG
jgi:hypothetical protein